ncbi:T7SS effector LXG polymorphic toxin [Carnobacterium gallinarum]|uniref:T7SS effector LXG polymorphic toxin n=1 Tax=Carnobacterium gallinarum TaxID=2749 RepID=UPI00068B4864|nr:T7SS effector LXG polymorphic toxin [Carnobacterium gallinarum]
MSSDMYVSASKKQAVSVSAMSKKQVQDYEDVQKAIREFTLNSPFLTGKAYDSAKQYFSLVLYPLGQAGILLSEAVERAVKRLPEDYQDQVDSGDLKQSELEEKIRQVNQLLGQAEDIRELIQSVHTPDILKNSQLQANMQLLNLYSDVKRSLEEKLDQLLRFNAYSETIFSEVDALQQLIEQGLKQTQTAWNGESKTFTVDRSKMDWALTVNEQWTSRENEINGIDEEKIKELEEYEVYAKLVYDGEGNPQVFWQLVKDGKGVKNPALYQYLKRAGHHLDPDMFEFISLNEWDKKMKAGFRDGVNLETGDRYSGFLGGLVSSSQVVEDMHTWATEAELAQALQVLGFSYASYRLAVGSGSKEVGGADVPKHNVGVVQSRINVANGRTRFTPKRPSTGKPVSAGFEHVYDGHFNRPLANSRSIFSITTDKLKQVLQSPNTVEVTVIDMSGGQYKRIVDTGEVIGNTALKFGGKPTSWIEIITDRSGNLITTYPVPKP